MPISLPSPASSEDGVLHRFVFLSDGVPSSGDFNDIAPKGALCINKATLPGLYQNTGTKAATVWSAIFQAV